MARKSTPYVSLKRFGLPDISMPAIRAYARQIAEINGDIKAGGTDPSHLPNDLLDRRDQMLTELNKLIQVNVTHNPDNSVGVVFSTGQPLVLSKVNSFEQVPVSP